MRPQAAYTASDSLIPSLDGGAESPLWSSVDRLIGRVLTEGGGVDGLLSHKLGPLAADWYERCGSEVPAALHEEKRSASLAMLIASPLMRRIRASVEGPLVLLKGPELAALYPPGGRRFSDVDVLTPSASTVQTALLRSGFVEAEEDERVSAEHHHLPPLRFPTIWLNVEVHSGPYWPARTRTPPPVSEILDAAIPSALGVDGVLTPNRLHHTLILASHAWCHEPFCRLRDLLDVGVLAQGIPKDDLDRTAEGWGIGRLWRTTWGAVEALFYDGKETAALQVLGRHLKAARERTVFENHLVQWLYPYWELPPAAAFGQMLHAAQVDFTPRRDERWGGKLRRAASALRHPRMSHTERR